MQDHLSGIILDSSANFSQDSLFESWIAFFSSSEASAGTFLIVGTWMESFTLLSSIEKWSPCFYFMDSSPPFAKICWKAFVWSVKVSSPWFIVI